MESVSVHAPDDAWEEADADVEALLDTWLVQVGDEVVAGQALATIIVVKTTMDVVAPVGGRLAAIHVEQRGTFGRGAALATIASHDGAAVAVTDEREAGADTRTAAPGSRLRQAVAASMVAAWAAPQVAVAADVDMSACLERQRELADERVTPTHLVIRAAALTLRDHPRLNGWVRDDGVELATDVNIGVAVAVDDGLVVPVVANADTKELRALAREVRDIAARSREALPSAAELRGGTFTVSALGSTGIEWFTPILNPPQIAILGVGRVTERPVVRNRELSIAPMTTLVLVFDHRAVDGYPAAQFVAALRDRLENPASL